MKILYFDLMGGISGDMTTAALLDLGVDFAYLKSELAKIGLSGYVLKRSRVQRGHAKATKLDVVVNTEKNYSYSQIRRQIAASKLTKKVIGDILKVYKALFDAETKVHGHKHFDIHFQQLGEIDSIVDIASACICLDKIAAGGIYYSAIPLNNKIAPATWELLSDKKVYFTGLDYENVTPTGMAILCALGKQIDLSLKKTFCVGRSGYGAGALDSVETGNFVRAVSLGESAAVLDTDQVQVTEANIDNMNPQFFEYIFERLFEAGALDVFIQNVYMKKTRPGFLITVLSNEENLGKISHVLFKETSTIGVRFYTANRLKLARKIEYLNYRGRKLRVKLVNLPQGGLKASPEYEDCRLIAENTKIPIEKIYNEIKQEAGLKWHSQA